MTAPRTSQPPDLFDRPLSVARRNRWAAGAGRHDFLLSRVADDIVDRLTLVRRQFAITAVIGAHHGVLGRRLRGLANVGTVIEMEAAPRLLSQCDGPKLQADEELLPFGDAVIDLAVSALSLQLVNDLPGTLVQIRRALRPDGLFLGALLGAGTLGELRQAFLAAEAEIEGGASPRVAPFVDVRDAGALLQRAGFALPVADSDTVVATYASPFELFQEIRRMGGANPLVARRRRPMRRDTLIRAAEIYGERYATADGRVGATFEIVTLTGWAPHESQQKPLAPGSARTRLAEALGVPEQLSGDKPQG